MFRNFMRLFMSYLLLLLGQTSYTDCFQPRARVITDSARVSCGAQCKTIRRVTSEYDWDAILHELNKRPQRINAEWTRDEDAKCWELHIKNMDPADIAAQLGRGKSGVVHRIKTLSRSQVHPAQKRLWGTEGEEWNSPIKLRSAKEVIQRIGYDSSLDIHDFSFDYEDRFTGVETVSFDAPNESAKGKERLLIKAIPEHRITAFRYKGRVVWHKPRRFDAVFGTGREPSDSPDRSMRLKEAMAAHEAVLAAAADPELKERSRLAVMGLSEVLSPEALKSLKAAAKALLMRDQINVTSFVEEIITIFEPSDLNATMAYESRLRDLLETTPDTILRSAVLHEFESQRAGINERPVASVPISGENPIQGEVAFDGLDCTSFKLSHLNQGEQAKRIAAFMERRAPEDKNST